MAGFRRAALALIVVFGSLAFIVSPLTASQPSCRAAGEDYALACDLIDGAVRGSLQGPDDVDAYRLVVLDFRSTVRVQLTEAPNGLRVRLLDWQHRVVTEVLGPAGSEAEAALDEPGVYYVLVDAPASESSTDEQTYGVQVNATYAAPLPRVVLFPTRGDAGATGGPSPPGGVTSLANGRYRLSTPRGGTPELGVGASRGLPLTSEATPNDFTFVGDARFERTVQKAAITVRFRYTPEAGGGGAYVLQVDPFLGQFRLSTSEEGRQETVAPWTAHPAARGGTEPMRIVVRAVGPTITVRLNGEQVVQVDDDQYTNGLIVVGTVTWSEAVNATFDNILVTTPAL